MEQKRGENANTVRPGPCVLVGQPPVCKLLILVVFWTDVLSILGWVSFEEILQNPSYKIKENYLRKYKFLLLIELLKDL